MNVLSLFLANLRYRYTDWRNTVDAQYVNLKDINR